MSKNILPEEQDGILRGFIELCHSNITKAACSSTQDALEYLHYRGLNDDTISVNKIGYCRGDCDLPLSINKFGEDINGKKDRELSYFILGRIIVPICDEFGMIMGFGTRKPSLEKGENWWNLPMPFYKGRYLYLLNESKYDIIKNNKVYIVEGYIDAIFLRQSGIKNVVAIMGTALTDRKIALLARYCNNVCFCFDTDSNGSGQSACHKSICKISKFNFCDEISIINGLPVGEDPDQYIKKNGVESFLSLEKVLTSADINASFDFVENEKNERIENAKKQIRI